MLLIEHRHKSKTDVKKDSIDFNEYIAKDARKALLIERQKLGVGIIPDVRDCLEPDCTCNQIKFSSTFLYVFVINCIPILL